MLASEQQPDSAQGNHFCHQLFNRISASPEQFLLFLGGSFGAIEGLYTSMLGSKFRLFSTVLIETSSPGARLLNLLVSMGIRSNWYYNLGAGVSALKKIFVATDEDRDIPALTRWQRHFSQLNNKELGHCIGTLVGLFIYVKVMSLLPDEPLDDLFKSPTYCASIIDDHTILNVLRNSDQLLLISGGLSNLFSYLGRWLDSLTNEANLFVVFYNTAKSIVDTVTGVQPTQSVTAGTTEIPTLG